MFLSIPVDEINNVPEPQVVHTTDEVKLTITDVTANNNKNGEPYLLVRFSFAEVDDAKTFTHYLGLPFAGQDQTKRNNNLRSLKYFFGSLGITPTDDMDPADLVGETLWAFVTVEGEVDSQYGQQNKIKRFVAAS